MIKLTKNNCTLITVIENKYNLEREALKCFTSWRQFGGELKDIPIKTICMTKYKVTNKLQKKLSDLNVEYIEKYIQPFELESGFFNMPLGCMMLEKKVKTEYIIYLDLDMFLIQEIPLNFDSSLVLEEYSFKNNSIWLNDKININNYFNTSFKYINTEFIISKTDNYIFKQWYTSFYKIYNSLKNESNLPFDLSIIEEYSFEKIINDIENDRLQHIAFRLDPDAENLKNHDYLFQTNHLKSYLNIIIDESCSEFYNFKPININIELNAKCLASCVFCNRKEEDEDILHLEKFKQYINKLIDYGIYEFELTPSRGEILTIPNINEYIIFLENHPKVKSYFFYTSLIVDLDDDNIDLYIKLFNIIKKGFIYFSCYWAKNDIDSSDFISITQTSQLYFENNIKLFNILIDNINNSNLKIIDRSDQNIDKMKLCLSNKTLKRAIINKKILFGKDGTYLYNIKYHKQNYKMINKFCEQFATCITVLSNGKISFCNFSNLPHRILCNIDNLDFSKVFTNHRLNVECGKCLNFEPAENKNIIYNNGPIAFSSFHQNLCDAQRNHNEQ